jgi:hypothetical protein
LPDSPLGYLRQRKKVENSEKKHAASGAPLPLSMKNTATRGGEGAPGSTLHESFTGYLIEGAFAALSARDHHQQTESLGRYASR